MLTGLAAAGAPLWAAFNNQPEVTRICVALTPIILLQGLTVVPEAIMRRKMTFRPLAIRTLIATVLGAWSASSWRSPATRCGRSWRSNW